MYNTKITVKFIFFLVFILFLQPAFCVETTASSTQRIFDEADLLTEAQQSDIQLELEKISKDLDNDFVIVTKNQLDGTLPRIFAEDFFRSQGYKSGAILIMSMAERDYYFATFGTAMKDYDARTTSITRRVQKRLTLGDYHGAFIRFTQLMRPAGFFDNFLLAATTLPPILIAFFLTLIIVIFLAYNHRGAHTVTSSTYAKPGAFKLISTQDKYLRTSTRRRKIQTSTSSGGGGGGRSSGGGGGKF